MRIGGVNNNNFIWQNKKVNTQQNEQPEVEESQEETSVKKDSIKISAEGKKARESQSQFEEMQNMYQDVMQQLENARAQGEAMSDSIKVRIKCLKIAMNIMCGDKVPPEDYKYLAENDPGLYGKAIMMRREKENPKKCDRVSEDEEAGVEESGGESGDSANVEAAESGGEVQSEASGDAPASSE